MLLRYIIWLVHSSPCQVAPWLHCSVTTSAVWRSAFRCRHSRHDGKHQPHMRECGRTWAHSAHRHAHTDVLHIVQHIIAPVQVLKVWKQTCPHVNILNSAWWEYGSLLFSSLYLCAFKKISTQSLPLKIAPDPVFLKSSVLLRRTVRERTSQQVSSFLSVQYLVRSTWISSHFHVFDIIQGWLIFANTSPLDHPVCFSSTNAYQITIVGLPWAVSWGTRMNDTQHKLSSCGK